jgi:SOS-response transcriptional repressor LexA
MRALGYNQRDVIEKSRGIIKKASMSQYYNGKGFPYDERLVVLCSILKTTEPWLVNGKGIENLTGSMKNNTLVYTTNEFPLIGSLDIDNWSANENMDFIDVDYPFTDAAFAMKVESSNMSPELNPGQFVLCDTSLNAVCNDFVLVKSNGSHAIRKLTTEGDKHYISNINPDWPNKLELINSTINIIGVIVKVWRNFR